MHDVCHDIESINKWIKLKYYFIALIISNKNNELGVYFWNQGKNELYYKDVKIEVF